MYMREMGTVELLTRQGEIEIAKRIEDGLNQVKYHMAHFPPTVEKLLEVADAVPPVKPACRISSSASSIPMSLTRSSHRRQRSDDDDDERSSTPALIRMRSRPASKSSPPVQALHEVP